MIGLLALTEQVKFLAHKDTILYKTTNKNSLKRFELFYIVSKWMQGISIGALL